MISIKFRHFLNSISSGFWEFRMPAIRHCHCVHCPLYISMCDSVTVCAYNPDALTPGMVFQLQLLFRPLLQVLQVKVRSFPSASSNQEIWPPCSSMRRYLPVLTLILSPQARFPCRLNGGKPRRTKSGPWHCIQGVMNVRRLWTCWLFSSAILTDDPRPMYFSI